MKEKDQAEGDGWGMGWTWRDSVCLHCPPAAPLETLTLTRGDSGCRGWWLDEETDAAEAGWRLDGKGKPLEAASYR